MPQSWPGSTNRYVYFFGLIHRDEPISELFWIYW